MPKLDAQLLAAYRATHYVIHAPTGDIALRIGQPCPALATLMRAAGVTGAAFLTACNPHSQQMPTQLNQQAQAALSAALAELRLACHTGSAIDPAGQWPTEPSMLALGISRMQALALLARFRQNACVFIDHSAIPALLLADAEVIE